MGMDLYSVRKNSEKENLYFRFNIHGWGQVTDFLASLKCDLSEFSGYNDGEIVSKESCEGVADKLDEVRKYLAHLMTCDIKKLPKKWRIIEIRETRYARHKKIKAGAGMVIRVGMGMGREVMVDLAHEIISGRKDGKTFDPEKLLKSHESDTWTVWDRLAYYLEFGEFCRKCSKLRGFKQW